MRRLLVAGCSLVVLAVAGVLAAGVGARTVGSAPAPKLETSGAAVHRASPQIRASPRILIPATAGSTCFVSAPRCSETPCVELVRSTPSESVGMVAAVARAVVVPSRPVPRRLPRASCGSAGAVPPIASLKTVRPSRRP